MIDDFPMPHRFFHVLDSVIATVMLVVTSSSTILLAQASDVAPSKTDSLSLLLLPLIGALLVSGGVIMLNPKQEQREKIIGRSLIAVFFSCVGPSSIALLHPALKIITDFPVLLLLAGGLIFGLVYILARPFVEQFYSRSGNVSDKLLDQAEDRFFSKASNDENNDNEPPSRP